MDRKRQRQSQADRALRPFWAQGRDKKMLMILSGAWFVSVGLLTVTAVKYPAWAESTEAAETRKSGVFSEIARAYLSAFKSVQSKLDDFKRADEENVRLRLENAHLRLVVESRRFECYAERSEKMTQEFEKKLAEETKSKTGRTLASIDYQIPMDLPPKELYALGVSYFRSRDDEKAAVIFTFLTGMEEDDSYKTAPNLVMTGITWYRLEHFEKAAFYFDEALQAMKGKSGFDELSRKTLLWKGLVSEKTGKHKESQKWLNAVLDLAPRSEEAAMINHQGAPSSSHEIRKLTESSHSGVAREPSSQRE